MAKKDPGLFNRFKGLWVRGSVDNVPPDHFSDSLNNIFVDAGVMTRDGLSEYLVKPNILRMALFKPSPPFTGTNVPRIIYLNNVGELYDSNDNVTPIFTNVLMTDFALVNFFGRCFISPSDGRVGLQNEEIYIYDGTGAAGFRKAAGAKPVNPLVAVLDLPLGSGTLGVGTYLISYAYETPSGFITRPATPFVAIDCFGESAIDITTLPLGPAGTVARWIIATKAIPLRADLMVPFDVATAEFYEQFLAVRVGDNVTPNYLLSFYDEGLVDSSDYLLTLLDELPAGVGLMDYKGRMISYGEYANPSIVRASDIGEPESFSSTSGFFITDPSDSTGVRSAVEFRNSLYAFKQQRGYVTQDNGLDASTWEVVNFEKAVGTEQNGIADVLDAKGASSEGFLIASRGALLFFNGVMQEPELSYKIRDLWLRISETYFYKVQAAHDPINKRIYILVPLDAATSVSHIIYGDYRDGLDPSNIKWDLWEFTSDPTSILIYNEFTGGAPALVTRFSNAAKIVTLNINTPSSDDGVAVDSYFELPPVRFSPGVSQFNRIRVRGLGPCTLAFTAFGEDKITSVTPASLALTATPGREFAQLMNLVSEQCRLKVRQNTLNEYYKINAITVEGFHLWDERPR